MNVRIVLEIGHEASLRTKRTQEGFTHDWEVFVKGCDGAEIHHYIEKVVFYLHETFPKPKRVVKEPPYSLKESGYAGFNLPIDIYLKNKDEPKKIKYNYDLSLQNSGPAIHKVLKEKFIMKDPGDDFRHRLLKGGGQIVSSSVPTESENKSNSESKAQLLNKPKLGGSTEPKKHKKADDLRETTFSDLFGPPIKRTKTPEPKPSGGGKDQSKKDKEKSEKSTDKERKNKSPVKDRDKDKRDKDDRKKDKNKDRERSKEHDRSSKDRKREKSPRRSISPSLRKSSPKRVSSPKRPPSPPPLKEDRKDDKDKEKRKEKDKEDSKTDKKYKKRDKEKESKDKDYKEHKEKDLKKDSKSLDIKEPSPLPPPTTIRVDRKEKPKEIKMEVKTEPDVDVKPKIEDKKDKHKHKKKDKDRDKDKDKDKEKRDKNSHKSKSDKKYEPGNSLFTNPKPEKKRPIMDDNENSNSSTSSTKEIDDYKQPSPAPLVQPPPPPPVVDTRVETKTKKDKTKKKEKKLEKEEKKRKRRDMSPDDEEPTIKVAKESVESIPVVQDGEKSQDGQENPEDYMRILQELQQKIMSLQDNTELQKVVKLIAATGRYEVSARTFDFDLCLLERSTVRRLQEFFATSS